MRASACASWASARQVASSAPVVAAPEQSAPKIRVATTGSGQAGATFAPSFVRALAIFATVVNSSPTSPPQWVAGGNVPLLTLSWHFSSALATVLKNDRDWVAAFF